ncbi:hypothetical protein KC19_3G087400 [Ceratodon purpureus]|uniref:DUF2470 domain-containing protein n=1 Tax=Ceratodon purpureus TaxID=3225 RepID=A0A8T0IGB5_CERPU|nr:hypothetical protein KC19_3G087400 [Ceratodon purpureus]
MAAMEAVLSAGSLGSQVLGRNEAKQGQRAGVVQVGWRRRGWGCLVTRRRIAQCVRAVMKTEGVVEKEGENSSGMRLLRPTPAEGARTVMEACIEGTLSTLSEDGWPLGTEVRFAVDTEGNPVLRLHPNATHTLHLLRDSRCSLHVQLEQPGRRKPQCTLQGFIRKVDDEKLRDRLEIAWERRFASEHKVSEDLYIMNVEQVLQSPDMGEEEIWVPGSDYWAATADPLRECAKRIVEDMNRNHWEDIRRFCNVYAKLDAELEEASMTWVDRLGFDLRVLTKSPQNILEIRIPFTREVADERDARSSLTIMAQIAWEQERSITPSEIVLATVEL